MKYTIIYKDGHSSEIWADNFNEARRMARESGDYEQIICDYGSIFTDLLNTIRSL